MSRRDIDDAERRIRSAYEDYRDKWVRPVMIFAVVVFLLGILGIPALALLIWLTR